MFVPTLEIIVTDVADALAAERGGADRLEIVSRMDADGFTPAINAAQRVRAAVAIPVRVMLRGRPGFGTDPAELDRLCAAANALRRAGLDQFVFGFLTADGRLDAQAIRQLHAAAAPAAWTLHRAFDQARDAAEAWATACTLPDLDLILSSGGADLAAGLGVLAARAAWQIDRLQWLAGGGLRADLIPPLLAAGIRHFHSGRAVRVGRQWAGAVDEAAVRDLQAAIVTSASSERPEGAGRSEPAPPH